MTARWPTIWIVILSVLGTFLAQGIGLYVIGWLTRQQMIREEAQRIEVYRTASLRLGISETTDSEYIRVYVDCERLGPGVSRETLEATLKQVGPYTTNKSEPYPNGDYIFTLQFDDEVWRSIFHVREYRFDVTHRLISSGWRETSAFSEVECPWHYLSPVEE